MDDVLSEALTIKKELESKKKKKKRRSLELLYSIIQMFAECLQVCCGHTSNIDSRDFEAATVLKSVAQDQMPSEPKYRLTLLSKTTCPILFTPQKVEKEARY